MKNATTTNDQIETLRFYACLAPYASLDATPPADAEANALALRAAGLLSGGAGAWQPTSLGDALLAALPTLARQTVRADRSTTLVVAPFRVTEIVGDHEYTWTVPCSPERPALLTGNEYHTATGCARVPTGARLVTVDVPGVYYGARVYEAA